MVDLGSSVADRSSRANAISDDGNVIVGWQELDNGFWQACTWIDDVQELITDGNNEPVGAAGGTNHDGSVIVGQGLGAEAWRWTEADGAVGIGVLPGFNYLGYAIDVSDDGSVVVGFCGFAIDRKAFIWTEDTGMVELTQYAADLGVDLQGWSLATATAISADGTIIGGWAMDQTFNMAGFILDLDAGAPCPEDIDGNSKVDVDDLFALLNAWGACGDCPEDINDDGIVNVDDLFAVLNAWGPCPS
jgi:uncharacterized membrane protein